MLTNRQSRFIDEYMIDFNGTRAAIRAGYSRKTARAIACENLKKPLIAEEIERRKQALRHECKGLELKVLEALMAIGTSNLAGIYDKGGHVKPPAEWPAEAWVAVKSYSHRERLGPFDLRTGKKIRKNYRVTVKAHDKVKALSLAGEQLGLFGRSLGRRPVIGGRKGSLSIGPAIAHES